MKAVVLASVLLALCAVAIFIGSGQMPARSQFAQWKLKHHKTYAGEEEYEYRRQVYEQNLAFIHSHRSPSYTLEPNKFMDLTPEEFSRVYLSDQ